MLKMLAFMSETSHFMLKMPAFMSETSLNPNKGKHHLNVLSRYFNSTILHSKSE